jgi:cyclopropane-fatty-acyl-phospholipid synthase
MKNIDYCGICESNHFQILWDLPKLPLTERFGPYSPEKNLAYDQKLLICKNCGHVQLEKQLDPGILYTSKEYSFRTGESASSRTSVAFFLQFLKKVSDKKNHSFVDIGGNDLYLARQLNGMVKQRCVIDPICAEADGSQVDGIQIYGRFIEEVDLATDLKSPDLIACRHTLEHIANPRKVLLQLFEQCDSDCLYLFEVPCFENLVEGLRFDAVFHQHYHYYDLASFKRLLWETGGEYIFHSYNHQGSCGGAMLIAFRKAKTKQAKPILNIPQRVKFMKERLKCFSNYMDLQSSFLHNLPSQIFGYGASLMLATLAYHLKTDLSQLVCILDDDPTKENWTYENLPVTVQNPNKIKPAPNSSYLITSLENTRKIFNRIQDFQPRRILVPLIS